MENTRPVIYATIIVFLIIFVFYRWIGEKAGLPRDALFTCFLVIFIPLALCWINDPLAKVTNTEECVITKTEHYTTKFSQVYHFNVKTGKKKFTYRATAKEFKAIQSQSLLKLDLSQSVIKKSRNRHLPISFFIQKNRVPSWELYFNLCE